ncbi:MAG: type III-B CRISPR module-associated protein Cmr5 [Coriobacteriia bacterium]|nr:type III-B CRISPR module-associated protein Cmr5 [Coriobacteriia bacterium]
MSEVAQTIQQQRAAFALGKMTVLLRDPQISSEEIKSAARAFPAMVHMSGLGQAAAFYRAGRRSQPMVYELFSEWLCLPGQPLAGHGDLLTGITQCDMRVYMAAQAEALALAEWVKRFAEAHATPSVHEPSAESPS